MDRRRSESVSVEEFGAFDWCSESFQQEIEQEMSQKEELKQSTSSQLNKNQTNNWNMSGNYSLAPELLNSSKRMTYDVQTPHLGISKLERSDMNNYNNFSQSKLERSGTRIERSQSYENFSKAMLRVNSQQEMTLNQRSSSTDKNRLYYDHRMTILGHPKMIKEGYVMVRQDSIFSFYEKRFLQLYESKLIFVKNPQERSRCFCSINLINYDLRLKCQNGCIEIELMGFNKRYIIKTHEYNAWFDAIVDAKKQVNKLIQDIRIPRLLESRRKFYLDKDIISVTEFKATCESGDIFLAKTPSFGLFSIFQKDTFDIVLAIHKEKNDITLFALNNDGLVSISLDQFIIDHFGQFENVGIRKLNYVHKKQIQQDFLNIFKEASLVQKNSNAVKEQKGFGYQLDNSWLIFVAFRVMGIFDPKAKFSKFPLKNVKDETFRTEQGAWFTNFIEIYPERHEIKDKTNFNIFS